MPHLTIEITGNLKPFVHAPALLQAAHQVLLQYLRHYMVHRSGHGISAFLLELVHH